MARKAEPEATIEAVDDSSRFSIGQDLYVVMVDTSSLKEQDMNAQIMQPREFDRLVENIRERGGLESLPYTHQPNLQGPISIVSGHHRFRAAREAGLGRIPVIVDAQEMSRGKIISKQIAHNELHGSPDEEILRQLVAQITEVDDLLRTGLQDDWMPTVEKDDTTLAIPHAEFDWRLVALTFLPKQLTEFADVMKLIEAKTDLVGVADMEQFELFAKTALQHGRQWQIKSMSSSLLHLARTAGRRIEVEQDEALEHVETLLGTDAVTAEQALVIRKALEAAGGENPAEALTKIADLYLSTTE